MTLAWRGYYLDGRTAARRPAAIQIAQTGLNFSADGTAHFWAYGEMRQTQGFYCGEQVRLEKNNKGELTEALLVDDAAFLTALHRLVPGLGPRFHQPERRRMRRSLTAFAALGAVAIGAALYLWAIPALAKVVAARVPVSWEEKLGQSVVDQLAPEELRCADPVVLGALRAMTTRLAAAARAPYKFRVAVVRLPVINAFAAPGGYVVVFQGLIEQTRTPEELAGVLAHELEHVIQKHTTRMLLQDATAGILLSALTGDLSGAVAFGAGAAHTLGTLRYNRGMEEEADVEGMKMLAAAGIDPAGMIAFFDTLKKKSGDVPRPLAYLSSHPSTEERIETLKALAARAKPAAPQFTEYDWAGLKKRCAAAAGKPKS